MRLHLCPPLPLLCHQAAVTFVFRWHCEEGGEEESDAASPIVGAIIATAFPLLPPHYCHRPATALPTTAALTLPRYCRHPSVALPPPHFH